MYQKYGFCKFKEKCGKRHLKEECKDLADCKCKTICNKRHPKFCKRYILDRTCRFGQSCEYLHKEEDKPEEENKLKERIPEQEEVVKKIG